MPNYASRTRRRQQTHDNVISIAADLFYRQGISNVSMDDIAAAAGVTKKTLYDHFPAKDELISACLSDVDTKHFDWFVAQAGQRVKDGMRPLLAVFDTLDQWFHSSVFRGCAFINATIQLPDLTHPAHLAVLTHKRRTRDWLRDLALSEGYDQGTAAKIATYLMILMEGAIITALVEEDPDAGRHAGEAAELVLARYST